MSSAAPALKAALVALLESVTDPTTTLVTYGSPGRLQPGEIVAVMDVESASEFATLGTQRNREETLDVGVVFSIFAGGGVSVQQTVTERAYALLGLLETELKSDPSIGGTVRGNAGVTSHALEEYVHEQGRVAVLAANVRAFARI